MMEENPSTGAVKKRTKTKKTETGSDAARAKDEDHPVDKIEINEAGNLEAADVDLESFGKKRRKKKRADQPDKRDKVAML
jgi:hypothetical protein